MSRVGGPSSRKLSVFFLIRSLERGGAERQLIELATGLAARGVEVTVGTLYDGGALRSELVGVPGIELQSFGKSGRWDGRFLYRLARSLLSRRPQVIHGYMSPANELATLSAQVLGQVSVWGLRASNVDLSRYDRLSRVLFRLCAAASQHADLIIVNSEAGRRHYVEHGYAPSHMKVIPNGIDCVRFQPDPEARTRLRSEWNIGSDERLLAVVARIDPMKDHETFLRALALMKHSDGMRFVCVGKGDSTLTRSLLELTAQLGLQDRLLWAGPRDDMSAVYNAVDVLVLSSAFGEGFPNVVGEAMAVGRPCVVTNVGDAAAVVGECGLVVPPKDAQALAEALDKIAMMPAEELSALGISARERIVAHFSTERLVDATKALLDRMIAEGRLSATFVSRIRAARTRRHARLNVSRLEDCSSTR